MAQNFGTGVSRVIDPAQSQFIQVIWQQGKPPLDSELNLLQQLSDDWRRILSLRGMPSGWLGNGVNMAEAFLTDASWSNWFRFGQQRSGEKQAIQWAAVNGWLVPVTGTLTGTPPGSPNDADTWNKITLDPPPSNSGDSRIDFVFLEVWQARIPPNPSADNKPSASGVWRYGNVEGGYSFLDDELQDPEIGFETTQRVQLQYRIRVVSGLVGLASYPDGFDPTLVKARGAATTDTSYTFENMRTELGDPGLWRAGDGTSNSLGTVDGYSYAVPIAAVFRRNSVAWDGDPGQNLNGSFNRNPTAIDRTGYATFSTTPSLSASLSNSALTLSLASVANIPLPLTPASPVTIQIDDEVLQYSVITGTTMTLTARGALGTKPESHLAGATIRVLSGRPDGLYADQIAKTDVLDLRHAVNPNGFDYETLLNSNLNNLLRGQLRANWKRSGAGPQGGFVFYQDKISNSVAALGVTKLDGPDNIRQVFSDAAVQEQVTIFMDPPVGQSISEDVAVPWGLTLAATVDNLTGGSGAAGSFNPTDVIEIPVTQFKTGLPGSDADQVRFLGSADLNPSVIMRIDGEPTFLTEGVHFSVSNPGPNDSLYITLTPGVGGFPAGVNRRLEVTVSVLYGPGRGMSRRPDAIHSIAYLSGGSDIMTQLSGVPSDNTPLRVAWAPLWSKYRDGTFNNLLPVTAEAYADPGSKTVILTPFRRIDLPDQIRVLDGTAINTGGATAKITGTDGDTVAAGSTFTSAGSNFTAAGVVGGDALLLTAPDEVVGVYPIKAGTVGVTTLDIEDGHTFPATVSGTITFRIIAAQGLMPLNDRLGAVKWTTTDPLGLFSGTTDPTASRKNLFLPLPRRLIPGWGEVRVPIMHSDPTTTPSGGSSTFDQGINFMVLTKKGAGASRPNKEKNYISFSNGTNSFAICTTYDFVGATPATYNTLVTKPGFSMAGMRFFTDTRGLGRKGLELPPFYGIARLYAVYEAGDWNTNGPAFDASTREPQAGATNLLRQDFDGAMFWIEIDSDGDSTFVLNADAIDITKSTLNPIASFEAGNYVIEASIFGFDRGSFSLQEGFRLVLNRSRAQAISGTRTANFGTGASAEIDAPDLILPGPALAADEVAINFSRTPYQGDAWGTQTSLQDISYDQGPMLTGTVYQLTSTELDEQNLTRPNQKVVEVLAATGFMTTMGTGRLGGEQADPATPDFRNVGWEDVAAVFPPATAVDARPAINIGALANNERDLTMGTEYHGCTERLPLGALFRDKDFRGGFVQGSDDLYFRSVVRAPLVFTKTRSPGTVAAGVATSELEQVEIPVHTASIASGQPGELLVHVDGEQGNYSLLTNYRTNRGGSVFSASSPRPGGEVAHLLPSAGTHPSQPHVLCGLAMLVRNTVTSVGLTEVSAGSELMMLIATSVQRLSPVDDFQLYVHIGTNGTREGYSAADLYRIEGHPVVRDNVKIEVTPSNIALTKKVT